MRLANSLALKVLLLAPWLLAGPQSVAAADPARVILHESDDGRSVRTADGELLRGGVVFVYKYQRDKVAAADEKYYPTDPSYWDAMKQHGLSAVRVVCFDPWQRSHGERETNRSYPFANWERRSEADALLSELDQIVELAAERQMHVLINYHDAGGYRDPTYRDTPDKDRHFAYKSTTKYIDRFWYWVASRYKDRTHVAYELANQPVGWHPNDYKAEHLDDFARIYQAIRSAAPDTHVVLGSFATPASFGQTMLDVADGLAERGVDFSNASIAFHPYDISDLPHSEKPIRQLMAKYAVINTEQGFPASVDDGTDDPDARGYGDDLYGVQSMERMKISWFQWNIEGPEEFKRNFVGLIIPDATAKGYIWD